MVKNGQDKSADLILKSGDKAAAACKDICLQAMNVMKSPTTITGG
jgi:Cys-tRNA synthase (O-phospho-L-seryl-tRNA:Cys-tRNA synthase)